jgi:mono/diheme cytochrome c family protein
MQLTTTRTVLSAAALIFLASGLGRAVSTPLDSQDQTPARQTPVDRGAYLVRAMGCNDCHTPWKIGPKGPQPDMSRELSGHPADLVMPPAPKLSGPWTWSGGVTNTAFAGPWGTSFTANLTPDAETGLGKWTAETFIATLRTGRHEGKGRPLLPPMPWPMIGTLTDEDLRAVFAYLQSLPPIRNRVPAPVDPEDRQ